MPRPVYTPPEKIQSSLYTSGKEWMFLDTNKEHIAVLEAKKLGIKEIKWQTPTFNTRAIKFYDRIGGKSKSKERYFFEVT